VLLVLFLGLSLSAFGPEEGDFSFEIEGVGARVSRYRGSKAAVVIPERLGRLPVTSIGDSVFSGRTDLTSVTIPNSVTNIGFSAFSNCTSLASVTIPNKVTSIEESAFANCKGLARVTVPDIVIGIGPSALDHRHWTIGILQLHGPGWSLFSGSASDKSGV
jgi:hypothetical protein